VLTKHRRADCRPGHHQRVTTATVQQERQVREAARNVYRRERLSSLVTGAREPLDTYFASISDDELLERLDRTLSIYDQLLSARNLLQQEIARGVQEDTAKQATDLRTVCEELNSAIANALMYGEIAAERNLC